MNEQNEKQFERNYEMPNMNCSECGAVVVPTMQPRHVRWHAKLDGILADKATRPEGHNGGYYPA